MDTVMILLEYWVNHGLKIRKYYFLWSRFFDGWENPILNTGSNKSSTLAFLSFLDRSFSIANQNYRRWRVPLAALSIHLCIGQIYAYSVFNEPMTRILGITQRSPDDWSLTTLGWIFSIALFMLGASAAVFGKWLERVGPRKAMFTSAICFCGGFVIAALGVFTHKIWLIYLGHGFLGGIGLGLGYISPVSTLIKWFPDRPGMATGMAIMGFGGGAMIASPLSVKLMEFFSTNTSVGVGETFLVMAVIYFTVMMFGVFTVRLPEEDWKPVGFNPDHFKKQKLISAINVDADTAIRTRQFWLVFLVLMFNVTAGIGVLGQASVMIQEMFSVNRVGLDKTVSATDAAGFVILLSLFNMLGRFIWSSLSDKIGRKTTYSIFFLLGTVCYLMIPSFGKLNDPLLFMVIFCVIMSMYGGGFATVPAYLKDLFGVKQVGAIHGRLLVAWSLAAIFGPVLVNYIRAYQIEVVGLPPAQAYSITMYIMAGLLVLGLICNFLIKPVNQKYFYEKGN